MSHMNTRQGALTESALVQIMVETVGRDIKLKQLISDLGKRCEYLQSGSSMLICKGPSGMADARKKLATLRDATTRDVLAARYCRRHLDAAALAVFWAVHGAKKEISE